MQDGIKFWILFSALPLKLSIDSNLPGKSFCASAELWQSPEAPPDPRAVLLVQTCPVTGHLAQRAAVMLLFLQVQFSAEGAGLSMEERLRLLNRNLLFHRAVCLCWMEGVTITFSGLRACGSALWSFPLSSQGCSFTTYVQS